MIWSVSTLARSSGAIRPVWMVKAFIDAVFSGLDQFAHVDEVAGHRGGGGHRRADQVGAATGALAPLEVAVGSGGAVLAAAQLVGFMARHIEQPGSRHSKPASMNTLSRPSASAWALTRPEPGTTRACLTLGATLRPRATAAAARRSSMRELVHEPMNTRSRRIEVMGWLGWRPMYLRARSIES